MQPLANVDESKDGDNSDIDKASDISDRIDSVIADVRAEGNLFFENESFLYTLL